MESMDIRKNALTHWLSEEGGFSVQHLKAMTGDASFRRYFRLIEGDKTLVAVDAPPPEKCAPFIAIANALRTYSVCTPEIIMADVSRGFLLLSDFGDHTFLKILSLQNADHLYTEALKTLAQIARCQSVTDHEIPPFTREFMWQEWAWHKEWYLHKYLGLDVIPKESELDACYALLAESAATQPQVFMHRDYHSGNLMLLSNGFVGVLDFQDAFIGPLTYDLASLLRDCYIDWPEDFVRKWALSYFNLLQQFPEFTSIDTHTFLRWFDLMGIQRHLKALLTFARKKVRDHQSNYLSFMPRTLNYITTVSAHYAELKPLTDFYRQFETISETVCEP